jgi:oligopeptide transport system substrate-binding protein
MAVDREAITDVVLRTGEIPAYSFVPPGTSNYGGASRPSWSSAPYDQLLTTAKDLLKQAGYGPERPLKLTIRYNTSKNYKRVAIAVQNMWRHIGVQAKLENSEVKVHYNLLEEGDFDIGRAGMSADYNDARNFLYLLQTAAGTQNFGRYSNPSYDRLMQQAALTTDPEARSDLLHRAERMALDDAAVIPIMYYISKSLVQPYVSGWVPKARTCIAPGTSRFTSEGRWSGSQRSAPARAARDASRSTRRRWTAARSTAPALTAQA